MNPKIIEQTVKIICEKLADEGKIVEGGWRAYEITVLPPKAREVQRRETRTAFYCGAMHVFNAIMAVMGSDEEPSETDMKRMNNINDELREFGQELELRIEPAQGNA